MNEQSLNKSNDVRNNLFLDKAARAVTDLGLRRGEGVVQIISPSAGLSNHLAEVIALHSVMATVPTEGELKSVVTHTDAQVTTDLCGESNA